MLFLSYLNKKVAHYSLSFNLLIINIYYALTGKTFIKSIQRNCI